MTDHRIGAVSLSQLDHCTIRGLTILYTNESFTTNQATITAASGAEWSATVPEGYPIVDWEAGADFSCNVFDKESRWWKPGTGDLYTPWNVTALGDRRFRLAFTDGKGRDSWGVTPGDLLGCRNTGQEGGCFTFQLDSSEACTMVDVTLYGGPCFGFFTSGTLGTPGHRAGHTFQRCSVRRPPAPAGASEGPLLSTSADGFHHAGAAIGPTILDSHFSFMPDDGIAIHGTYHLVVDAQVGATTSTVTLNSAQLAEFSVGDSLRLYSTEFTPLGETVITSVAPKTPKGWKPQRNTSHTMPMHGPSGGYIVLGFANAAITASQLRFDCIAVNANRTGNFFSIKNTTIEHHRARGMLIKASHGTIENNTIDGSTMGGIIITPELYWAEADYARDLVVRHNVIKRVGLSTQGYGGLAIGAVDPEKKPARRSAKGYGHANIHVEGNRFEDSTYNGVWISSSSGVSLVSNVFLRPFDGLTHCCEPIPEGVVVWLTNSDNLNVSGNCIVAAGPNTTAPYKVEASASGEGLRDGVKVVSSESECGEWRGAAKTDDNLAPAARVFDVLAHGAKGDGTTDDSRAIAAAYAACRESGGGTVLFRDGHVFVSGPVELSCNDSTTVVERGATLRARNTTTGWPFGLDCPEPAQGSSPRQMAPMLLISNGRNISIEGGGAVDANGEMWWSGACGNEWCPHGRESGAVAFRPFLFRVDRSVDVRVEDIELRNSGFWTLVPVHSSSIRILDVNVSAAWSPGNAPRSDLLDTPNTDGMEPMWSSNVYVSGARIINGDDCITVKSGSSDILVEDLYCEHGDGLTIGSIWYDDVSNVTYRRVVMNRTHNGPMVKGRSQGNATVSGITFEDVLLLGVRLALTIDCDYETPGTVVPNEGVLVTRVVYRNITGTVRPGVGLSADLDDRGDPTFLVRVLPILMLVQPSDTFLAAVLRWIPRGLSIAGRSGRATSGWRGFTSGTRTQATARRRSGCATTPAWMVRARSRRPFRPRATAR